MKPLWTKCRWTRDQLNGKRVMFCFPVKDGEVRGIGEFLVSENPEGLLFVQIIVERQGQNWAERIQTLYQIPQAGVDRIAPYAKQEVADFLLA